MFGVKKFARRNTFPVTMAFVPTASFFRRQTNTFLTTVTPQRTRYALNLARRTRDLRRLLPMADLSQNRHSPATPVKTDDSSASSPVSYDGPQKPVNPDRNSNEDPPTSNRLFSNIAPREDGVLVRKKPSELAAAALISGTMIGAGVLALPTVAAPSGFVPSTAALFAVWAYMAATGLLISEVTISTACALGRSSGVSMLSLGRQTLGTLGATITTTTYLLLHYAILTAYVSEGSTLVSDLLPNLPASASAAVFACLLGFPLYALPGQLVDAANNVLVVLAAVSFTMLLASAAPHVHPGDLLTLSHWQTLFSGPLIPVLLVSCVYHNVIPTISLKLEGDRAKIRRAILAGTGIPVLMFALYDAVKLPLLQSASALTGTTEGTITTVFSFLAVATSFIGFVAGLTDLVSDARQSAKLSTSPRWPDYALTLVPPVIAAAAGPEIFIKALDVAGTYGIAVLFGALPAAMAWSARSNSITKRFAPALPGGRPLLVALATPPLILITSRVWEALNVSSVAGL